MKPSPRSRWPFHRSSVSIRRRSIFTAAPWRSDTQSAPAARAREALPDECCGLLIGTPLRIDGAQRARNLEPGSTRFLIDPRDHFAAIHAARESRRFVVGVYHSHPRGPAAPSPADLAEASY